MRIAAETFGFDAKTIRRWGQSLRRGDAQELIRVLEGRAHRRKCTPQIEAFVRLRLPELRAERRYGAMQRLRREIKTVFRVEISAKSLSSLIGERKGKAGPPAPEEAASHPEPRDQEGGGIEPSVGSIPAPGPAEAGEENREIASLCLPEGSEGDVEPNPIDLHQMGDEVQAPPADNTGKLSPSLKELPSQGQWWCEHAGLLMFAAPLIRLNARVETAQPALAQWLSSLLLGAHNIEQTKFLNWEDLELILGQVIRFPLVQRAQLKALSTEATLDGLWALNAEILEAGVGADFYFDPHTKHYTGEQNVLKGWCAKIRWADKVLQSDFIHTAGGAPLYFETTDSFEDMRERFFDVIARARATLKWPAQREVSYVVDRGIFGAEVFAKILADPSHQRRVTGPGEGSTDQERPTQGVGQTSAESAWATGATLVGSRRGRATSAAKGPAPCRAKGCGPEGSWRRPGPHSRSEGHPGTRHARIGRGATPKGQPESARADPTIEPDTQ